MENINVTESVHFFKWWVDLNVQAKTVIALLTMIILFLIYYAFSANTEINNERKRYDDLSDKYQTVAQDCKKVQDSINAVWFAKYDDYRTKREAELLELSLAWEAKYDAINNKIARYERRR